MTHVTVVGPKVMAVLVGHDAAVVPITMVPLEKTVTNPMTVVLVP